MSTQEITAAVTELQELRRMQEEIAAEADAIADRIKEHMNAAGLEMLTAGPFKVSYTTVSSTRIDTTALRRDLPEIWQEYGRTTESRRFTVR